MKVSNLILEEVSHKVESLGADGVLVDVNIPAGHIVVRRDGYAAHVKSLGEKAATVDRLTDTGDETFSSMGVPSLTYHSSIGVLRDISAFLLLPELD